MEFADVKALEMILVFILIAGSLYFYATEKLPLEVTSLAVICALMVVFHLLPITGPDGKNILTAHELLAGFANPAMLTVLALLILGEGLNRTGALDTAASVVYAASRGRPVAAAGMALLLVCIVSAVLNNIPVVVLFIPIMQALAVRSNRSAGRLMMPLSFAAILGGMTTLIGSSTNLLVSSAMIELGEDGFDFFSFTIPGLVVAAVGFLYVAFVLPRLMPDREGETATLQREAKQFKAQITVKRHSKLDGMTPTAGFFPGLAGITVLSIERDGDVILPPYEDVPLQPDDALIVAATREKLLQFQKENPGALTPDIMAHSGLARMIDRSAPWQSGAQSVAEVMVTPGSRMVGRTLDTIGFRYRHDCVVLGVERRSRMQRTKPTEIPLEPGDILLIQGRRADIEALRGSQEVVLLEWSAEDLPKPHHAKRAGLIFLATVGAAATGLLPTEVATLSGAAAMVIVGALSAEEAIRALDHKIIMLIAAALSLGTAMQATGGAAFLAHTMVYALGDASPAIILSGFFLLTACLANILSTKATAVLFTPIAVAIAHGIGVPAEPFAVAVVFAANCSFASPVGYQTNLLVMAPGGYKFKDFVRAGTPLLILCWITFSLFAPYWYDL
ncbi:SLC13 family permease [Rhodospirillaceae bacterium KN72]|uniref:SLC13 family permease n=1 Tax=Pacificispira spongiicola TaxID=2729598 RepID=A0A7Y0DWH8_9PROT|nr:SLC13 family permease [Pacificispira spongiicola]NMM42889.1 SLC13 family permease [Pacificispira spongiicola]